MDSKNNAKNNGFLITCVSSIVVLLTLCYFGINSSFRGTSAAQYTCNSGNLTDGKYCCPVGYYSVKEIGSVKYCVSAAFKYDGSDPVCVINSETILNEPWYCNGPYGDNDGTITGTMGDLYYECRASWENNCTVLATDAIYVGDYNMTTAYASFYNGSSLVARKSCTYNDSLGDVNCSIDVPTTPTKAGYTFNGWGDNSSCSSGVKTSTVTIGSDKTYYACWLPTTGGNTTTASATFMNGTTNLGTRVCTYNDTLGEVSCKITDTPSAPTKLGYTFNGWGKDLSCSIGEMQPVISSDTTLYPCWLQSAGGNTTTVTATFMNGTTNLGTRICTYNDSIGEVSCKITDTPIPTKLGYTFNGWSKVNSTCSAGEMQPVISSDTTLYPCWLQSAGGNTTTVTATFMNGTTNLGTRICTYNDSIGEVSCKITDTPIPTKTGYTFNGWSKTDSSCTSGDKQPVLSSDTTYYACWLPTAGGNTTTVAAIFMNGTTYLGTRSCTYNDTLGEVNCKIDSPVSLSKDYYTFTGWGTTSTCTSGQNSSQLTISNDITFYACWNPYKYYIKYDGNGSTSGSMSNSVHNYNVEQKLTKNAYIKTGYVFTGWNVKSNGIGKSYLDEDLVLNLILENNGYVTLYAQWEKEIISVNIPTATNYCKTNLVYTGSNQTLTNAAGTGYKFSNNTQKDAGTHTVTATLDSGYVWNDGSTGTKVFSCSIAKATPTITFSKSALSVDEKGTATFTIKGSVIGDYTITSGSTSKVTVSPSTKVNLAANTQQTITVTGVAAGTSEITVAFVPNDTNNYNTPSPKKVSVTVSRKDEQVDTVVNVPTASEYCKTNLVYTGSNQTLTNAAGTGYKFSNNTQKDAGTHTVTATLDSGYVWNDGLTGTKEFSCSIAKADATLNITENRISIYDGESSAVNYVYIGDGKLSCDSRNTSVAVCEVKDGKLIIVSKSVGVTEVLLKAGSGNNYNSSLEVSVSVSVVENFGNNTSQEIVLTATFNANNGVLSGGNNRSCKTTSGSCVVTNLPIATRDGYIFNGWDTRNACTSGTKDNIILSKDTTYYACWAKNAVDEDGNVEDNVQTGDIVIALVWFFGLFAIGYAVYYFKSIKQK